MIFEPTTERTIADSNLRHVVTVLRNTGVTERLFRHGDEARTYQDVMEMRGFTTERYAEIDGRRIHLA